VADVCKVGDPMQVKVISIDDQDRVKLSRRAAMRELNPKGGDGNKGRN
jgi:polyribonucleotide nucleotidyltransferase